MNKLTKLIYQISQLNNLDLELLLRYLKKQLIIVEEEYKIFSFMKSLYFRAFGIDEKEVKLI
jgi:hypothetical protein